MRTLLPYQSSWVQDAAPLALIEKSRRIGISWAEAYGSVMHASDDLGDIYYQSYDKDMTRGFIEDCAGWITDLNIAAGTVGESLLQDEGRDIQVFRINFPKGRKILSMTSSPRGFRSKGRPGDIAVVDEAAFVDNIDEVLKAALSFINWGGRVRIISTHNGQANAFNTLVRDAREGRLQASLHRVTLRDALDQGLYSRIAAVTGQPDTPEAAAAWEAAVRARHGRHAAEELDCIPSAGGGAWITWEQIMKAEEALARQPDRSAGTGPIYIGVDVARRRDLWVAAVVEDASDALWLLDLITLRDAPFSEQRAEVRRLAAKYRPLRILVDQTGMGEAVVEQYQEDHGTFTVEGVLMTAPRRLDVATALREAFEDLRMRIHADEDLRNDIYSVRAEPGATGAPRLVADRAGTDGHADRFWALALAAYGAASVSGPWQVTPGAPRQMAAGAGIQDFSHLIDPDLPVVRSPLFAGLNWR
ncbi:hypothetical protein [Ruegeria atlantica]|uniref:phage terminase large subunit family protein n=1 Tax=Ruegeria atlantica TaxID=81569 RepID=UPI001479AB75|nr:hypothetical protein [Ruegeria atlantica]